jgi:Lon protease-like protein
MNDPQSEPETLEGPVRLFPLPNFVLLPHVLKPLHIFEPRYRQMTADALAADRLIVLVQLRPGWESDYEGTPAFHDMGCLARILQEERLPDGKYNLLVRGLCRVRLERELPTEKLYRLAAATPLHDAPVADPAADRDAVVAAVRRWLPTSGPAYEQFRTLLETAPHPGALCDILTFALPWPAEAKQALLEELDVAARIRKFRDLLERLLPPPTGRPERRFPPEFSAN